MRSNNTFRYVIRTLVLAFVVSPATLLTAAYAETDSTSGSVIVGKPTGLSLAPGKVEVKGHRARRQLLVTAQYESQELRDLSSVAKYTSSNPKVVVIKDSVA